jgi:hypothetical protein
MHAVWGTVETHTYELYMCYIEFMITRVQQMPKYLDLLIVEPEFAFC